MGFGRASALLRTYKKPKQPTAFPPESLNPSSAVQEDPQLVLAHCVLLTVSLPSYNIPVIGFSNITGALSNKRDEIRTVCSNFNCDIFCVVETWCSHEIPNSALEIKGFTLFRRDRQNGKLMEA